MFRVVPRVLSVVYSTCSSYQEENEEVVSRALEHANARTEQEGEPKQANFRSASSLCTPVPPRCPLCFCSCRCLSVSVCLAVCQPAGLFVSFPPDTLLSKFQLISCWNSGRKNNQRGYFMSLKAVRKQEKNIVQTASLFKYVLYVWGLKNLRLVELYHSCRSDCTKSYSFSY